MPGEPAGMGRVRALLVSRLQAQLPAELAGLELELGRPTPAPEDDDPDFWAPDQWWTGDPDSRGLIAATDRTRLEPEDYPAVLVVPRSTLEAQVVDLSLGRVERIVPYVVRTFVFVRHWGDEEVAAARDRLALAVEQAYLRQLRLSPAAAFRAGDGWASSYSEVGVNPEDQRSYAGWYLDTIVDQAEQLADVMLAPGDPGDELDPTVVVHPAL